MTRAHLDRIAADDDRLGAFLHVDADAALAAAAAVRSTPGPPATLGPLAGVPVALKDVVVTEGVPTTSGSKILEGWLPPYDATDRRAGSSDAGTVLLGKTNMDEFAMGSSTENSAYQVTRNPWDLDRIPGGSSGGSSARGRRRAWRRWAIGTDTGGSIRQPAAVTGLVGHKPTYGSVSRYGLIAFSSSLDQAGPMARTVLDAALLHEVIGGHDPLRLHQHRRAAARAGRRRPRAVPTATCPACGSASSASWAGRPRRRLRARRAGPLPRGRRACWTGWAPRSCEVSCPAFDLALPAYYLIAPERGVVQPGPLRRRPLRPAGRRRRQPRPRRGHGADPRAGLRPRGEAPDHPRHLRAVQRLLRGLLRAGAEGPHADHPRLHARPSTTASTCWSARPRRPSRSRSAPGSTTRSRCTPPTCARCRRAWPACRRSRCPCGLSEGLPVGLQIMAPALADDRCYRVAAALEAAQDAARGHRLLDELPAAGRRGRA